MYVMIHRYNISIYRYLHGHTHSLESNQSFCRLDQWPVHSVHLVIQPASIAQIVSGAVATPKWRGNSTAVDTLPAVSERQIHSCVCKKKTTAYFKVKLLWFKKKKCSIRSVKEHKSRAPGAIGI